MKNVIFQRYLKKIQSTYKNRPNSSEWEFFLISSVFLIIIFAFISFSVFIRPEGYRFAHNFYSEDGSITILSVTLLAIASFLSYVCFFMKPSNLKHQRLFFLIIALALTFLALDEILHFHEKFGDYLDSIGFMKKAIFSRTSIRRWNDLLIVLYGVVSLPVLIGFLPIAIRIPYIVEYFLIGFFCFAVHTLTDAFIEPPTTFSYIIEESAKLFTSAFLVLGLISALLFFNKFKNERSLTRKRTNEL